MGKSLANIYRPSTFNEVVGQEATIKILEKQIETNKIRNAYLFYGSSGCGKTTVARIFANVLNKGKGTPIEIDGASNNGVENVKQIIQSAKERAIDCEYKVYIIDECHSLTTQAWQAFLKCIEETPKYTVFIFCTTEHNKVPSTIVNRVMDFNFTKLSSNEIENKLIDICKKENYINYVNACNFIAKNCYNQLRDAINMLDKCSSYSNDLSNYSVVLNACNYDDMFNLIDVLIDGKEKDVLSILNIENNKYSNFNIFVDDFISFCLDLSKYIIFNDISVTRFSVEDISNINKVTAFSTAKDYYFYVVKKLISLKELIAKVSFNEDLIYETFIEISRCV